MRKYEPLAFYLSKRLSDGDHVIEMTFVEIEEIIDAHIQEGSGKKKGLPPSAHDHDPWWQGGHNHAHADEWERAGFKATPHRSQQRATFTYSGR